jgi:hypothetical protein
MRFEELSEVKELVNALTVLVNSNVEFVFYIDEITLTDRKLVDCTNIKYPFKIKLDSDSVENLVGNSKRVKVSESND